MRKNYFSPLVIGKTTFTPKSKLSTSKCTKFLSDIKISLKKKINYIQKIYLKKA